MKDKKPFLVRWTEEINQMNLELKSFGGSALMKKDEIKERGVFRTFKGLLKRVFRKRK